MSTQRETIEFILDHLAGSAEFSARAMFGEYALYANKKVVALVCDNQLYVKILPASALLEDECEKDTPYPGAKLHYVVTEDQIISMRELRKILLDIAKSLPEPKKKVKKSLLS